MHLHGVSAQPANRNWSKFMKRSVILVLVIFFGLLLLASCGLNEQGAVLEATPTSQPAIAEGPTEEVLPTVTETLPPPATETAVPATSTTDPTPTDEAENIAEEALPTPTVAPTLVPNPEVLESNCLNCHSNQQLLMDLATPEEEPEESESSGVG
jgi:hypothetical protein